MPDPLEQEEVDALLNLVNRGARGPEPERPPQFYDFQRPERVSKEQITALETLHEDFARNLSASLSGYLGTVVEVRLTSVEQLPYSEFTLSLPSPTSITRISCAPLEGNMILEINPSIIFPVIDRLLGSGSTGAYLLDRPFTGIEQGLVNSILTRALEQLTLTWENVRPTATTAVRFEIIETETNPFLMQTVAPEEPVVLHSFEMRMAEHSGRINLCIPFRVIEPILRAFSTPSRSGPSGEQASPGDRELILANLAEASLDISAIVAEFPLRLTDLLTLKPGDLIDTGKPATSELILAVESEQKFTGFPGTSQGKLALRITRTS